MIQSSSYTGYNKKLKQLAQELRRNMTPQEKQLWYQYLKTYKVQMNRQRIIENYIVDFYCSEAGLVIEIDGSQHYTEEGLVNDTIRTDVLQRHNLQVIRFTNRDIDQNFEGVCLYINQAVQARLKQKYR